MAGTVKVRVRDGWGVVVDGTPHSGGAEVSVPADLAEHWQAQGWVERVKPAAKTTTAERGKRT